MVAYDEVPNLVASMLMAFTFKFFTEVLFLSIILCLANTGIVNVLVSTLYSKPDEVTGYECGLYSTKGGRPSCLSNIHHIIILGTALYQQTNHGS